MKRLASILITGALLLVTAWPACAGEVVPYDGAYRPGSIVIVTHARELYFMLGGERAVRYPVGVGRAGMAWHGRATVAVKYRHPAWRTPPSLNNGHYGPVIPGGSPRNPRSARRSMCCGKSYPHQLPRRPPK
jgi:lipoprotein-anchoring transpeptidase ErfK/SrfK